MLVFVSFLSNASLANRFDLTVTRTADKCVVVGPMRRFTIAKCTIHSFHTPTNDDRIEFNPPIDAIIIS